jgi:hypothetical protein
MRVALDPPEEDRLGEDVRVRGRLPAVSAVRRLADVPDYGVHAEDVGCGGRLPRRALRVGRLLSPRGGSGAQSGLRRQGGNGRWGEAFHREQSAHVFVVDAARSAMAAVLDEPVDGACGRVVVVFE